MHHLSFQLLDITETLEVIDYNRYSEPTNAVKPTSDGEYDNPENILNRLANAKGEAQLGLGCAIGYIIESDKLNNLVTMQNSYDPSTDDVFAFHEFYNPSLEHQFISSNEMINNVGWKTSIFSLPSNSYFFKGANIQLGDTINFDGKTSKADFNLTEVGVGFSRQCFLAYVNAAIESTSKSDMEESEKAVLLRDLKLLKYGNETYIPSDDFVWKLGGSYTQYATQTAGPRLLSGIDVSPHSSYSSIFVSSFDAEVLKRANLDEGYLGGLFPFRLYALFVSIGEEGVDDNCALIRSIIDYSCQYESTISEVINKSYSSVQIEALPRNRVKVKYTITAVPNGTNSVSFKATY